MTTRVICRRVVMCVAIWMLGALPAAARGLAAPLLGAPAGTAIGQPQFSWMPVATATQYQLWIDDRTGNRLQAWYTSAALGCDSGTCRMAPGVMLAEGAVTWWVRAWSETLGYGPWSTALGFTETWPPAAVPNTPSGSITTSTLTFTWSAVSGTEQYNLMVNDTRGTVHQQWYTASAAGCASGTGTCTIAAAIMAAGPSTWWVQAWNSTSGYGPWSAGRAFTRVMAPSTAMPQTPSGAVSAVSPTFTWLASPDATEYYLWVDDSRGTVIKRWYTAAAAGCAAGTGVCRIAPGVAIEGAGTWWVQTWNPWGAFGAWSVGRSFSVPASTGSRMRVLQWNLHHGVGTDGVYDIGRIASWIVAMTPDVVMLNEVEKNTFWGHEDQPARYKALLESKTGRPWYSVFAQEFGDWTANGKGHLILSRYPIQATAMQAISYDRAIGLATITVNGRPVTLIVTHLDPDSKPIRLQQAKEVIAWASGFAENRVLAGDMNAWPDQTSILEYSTAYLDSWTVADAAGRAQPIAGINPAGATRNGRIDYIMYSKGAPNLVAIDSKVFDTRDAAGVMPSDHRPVVTTFEVR